MDTYPNESTEHLCETQTKPDLNPSSRISTLIENSNINSEQFNDEEAYSNGFNFENKNIRSNFCLKVFLIISIQFAVTTIATSWFVFDPIVVSFNKKNASLFIIIVVISVMILTILGFCGELRRQIPVNYAFLLTVTISKAFLLATIASSYSEKTILVTVALISVTSFALSIFAAQTYVKFTFLVGFTVSLFLILGCSCFLYVYTILTDPLHTLYASICALIILTYFIYEVLAMVQGNHTFTIAPYESIFAALCTFIDLPNVLFGACFICLKDGKMAAIQ